MTERIAYTRQEAAAVVGVGVTTFEERIQPELRVVRVGRKVLIPAAELRRWVDDHAERVLPTTTKGTP